MEVLSTIPPDKPVASVRVEHSTNLAIAWMFAALGGAVAITVLADRTELRLFGLIGIMLAYGYYGFYSPGRNTAKLADSIYFLGFLWTLYALINEFVIRHGTAGNAESVYRIFGYALVTTAFGMFCRLFLLQFHETVSDQMEEARDDIDIRLAALVGELIKAELQIARWREVSARELLAFDEEMRRAQVSVRDSIEAVHRGSAETLASAVKESVLPLIEEIKNISGLTRKMRTAVTSLEKASTTSADGFVATAAAFAAKVSESAGALDRASTEIVGRIKAMDVPQDAISAPMRKAGGALETAASEYAARIASHSHETATVLRNSADAGAHLLQTLTSLDTAATRAVDALSAAQNKLKTLPALVDGAVVDISQIRDTGVAKVQGAVSDAVAAAGTAKDAALALNRTVDEVMEFVRTHVDR